MYSSKKPLPGLLDHISVTCIELVHWSNMRLLVITMEFYSRVLIVNYDIDHRYFMVTIDSAEFNKIKLNYRPETVGFSEALYVIHKVLVMDFKEAVQVDVVKKWRSLLQVYPAKLLTLNK